MTFLLRKKDNFRTFIGQYCRKVLDIFESFKQINLPWHTFSHVDCKYRCYDWKVLQNVFAKRIKVIKSFNLKVPESKNSLNSGQIQEVRRLLQEKCFDRRLTKSWIRIQFPLNTLKRLFDWICFYWVWPNIAEVFQLGNESRIFFLTNTKWISFIMHSLDQATTM